MFINLEIERLRRQLTKAEMAEELCITPDTLRNWITRREPIPADGMRALLKLFEGTSLDHLLSTNPCKYTKTPAYNVCKI